jgi:hypothetical protein
MGITGSGKSTFIKKATGDTAIKVGDGLQSGKLMVVIRKLRNSNSRIETKDVQESIVFIEDDRGNRLKIHLIDTPGFDDDFDSDPNVLYKIANWINSLYNSNEKISGILYLHDVSLTRMRGSGRRNLEMVREVVGKEKFEFLTLVTTHWHTLTDPKREKDNEASLKKEDMYWRPFLKDPCSCATMRRFNNTVTSALEIVKEHLQHTFVPSLTYEMVTELLPLNDTRAGKIVGKNLEQAYREALKKAATDANKLAVLKERYQLVKERLQEKFDKQRMHTFHLMAARTKKKQHVFRAIRWTARVGTIGGVTCAIVLTGGLATPVLAAIPLVEAWAQVWSAHDKHVRQRQKEDYDSRYTVDFKAFQTEEELEEGDVADINSV